MAHKHVIIIYKIDSTKVMVAQMDKMALMVVQKTVHFDTKKSRQIQVLVEPCFVR